MNFDPAESTSGDSPQTVVANLAPGLLSNLNANPACLAGDPASDPQQIAGCDIGSASISVLLNGSGPVPIGGTLFLEPPAAGSGDVAGIDVHLVTNQDQYLGVAFNPSSPGGLTLTSANLPDSLGTAKVQVTSIQTSFNDTLNGQPFNRLPTSCATATSAMNVTYYSGASGSATNSFTPTGCASLPYAPKLTAAVTADPATGGAEVKTDVTQAADEAASKSIAISFPSGLTPNAAALLPCLSGTPCTIGTASATSPLIPGTLSGTVSLGGSVSAPTFAISFPAPENLTLTGAVNLSNNSVSFSDVPDVPLTDLSLDITGVNGKRAFVTDCKPAGITGSFTGQGGQTDTVTAPITLTGQCPASTGTGTGTGPKPPTGSKPKPKSTPKPKASGSISGLAGGHPKLTLKLTDAPGAKLTGVTLGLPSGLKFSGKAIVRHRACTTKGKKRTCTTTVRVKGLRLAGGSVKTIALKGGRLVVTLKKAVARVTLTARGPLLTETKSLQTKVKRHRAGTLSFRLKLITANHKTTSLTLKLKAH